MSQMNSNINNENTMKNVNTEKGSKDLFDRWAPFKDNSSDLLDLRDQIYAELQAATALIVVASHDGFFEHNQAVMQTYLFATRDLMISSFETYQKLDQHLWAKREA
jgi:hypothetical protein